MDFPLSDSGISENFKLRFANVLFVEKKRTHIKITFIMRKSMKLSEHPCDLKKMQIQFGEFQVIFTQDWRILSIFGGNWVNQR